ncbi:MAG: alkaline phosphatase [Acidobacteriota bacterium]
MSWRRLELLPPRCDLGPARGRVPYRRSLRWLRALPRRVSLLCAAASLLISPWGPAGSALAEPPPRRALILCVGDGFGWGALSIAEQLLEGSTLLAGAEAVGALRTNAYDEPVTDSAAAATAIATGQRTRNAWLALHPETRAPLETLAEAALERGLAVGLVTTSGITHATPAAFAAHGPDRYDHDPIAEQMASLGLDMMAGGDRAYFLPRSSGGLRADDRNLLHELRRDGAVIAETLALARAADPNRPLVFLYAETDPPYAGPDRPPLEEMLDLALERLSRDADGFFLLIEGAQIDWAEHDKDASKLPAELAEFDQTVSRARRFAHARGNTAVVVVADHDTGGPAPLAAGSSGKDLEIRFLTDTHTALLVPVLVTGGPARDWARQRHLKDLGSAMREWLLEEKP